MEHGGIGKRFRTSFLTGLFVSSPLALTIICVIWLFKLFDSLLGGVLEHILGRHIWGLGFVLSVAGVFIVGVLATTVIGRRFLGLLERLMMNLPVFKSIYSTFKQLGDAFSPHNKAAFKQFVIVEYPSHGVHSFGFLTKECMIKNDDGKEECYVTVYVPTNHLYLGDIALIRKEEVIVTDLTIEEGIRVVLSAGIAAPNVINRSRDYSLEADAPSGSQTGEAA